MDWNQYGVYHTGKKVTIVIQLLIVIGFLAMPAKGQQSQENKEKTSLVSNYAEMEVNRDITKSVVLNKIIFLKVENAGVMEALNEIADKAGLKIAYNESIIESLDNKKVTLDLNRVTIHDALWEVLEGTDLRYVISSGRNLVLMKREEEKTSSEPAYQEMVSGTVVDSQSEEALPGVTIVIKGSETGTTTDVNGSFEFSVPSLSDTLVFSYVGYQTEEVPIDGRTEFDVALQQDVIAGEELVVVGFGTQEKQSITGSISTVGSESLGEIRAGSTVSTALSGKVPGLSFRQSEGRPGAGANIQIRNMGTPLYVIDGIVKDEGQFNNLSQNDIEDISILKDASASAIYGSRAANGVVVVTTKRGDLNTSPTVSIDTYYGFERMTRFPNDVLTNGYDWYLAAADAEMNRYGSTNITQGELDRWQEGTEYGYQSFNWPDFIYRDYAPKASANVSVSGGGETTNYYFSVTRLDQDAVYEQYNFNRTNLQSNIDSRVANGLQVGIDVNARVETRVNPGIPGFDDYWLPRFASLRNRPTYGPYANGNSEYLNDIGHTETNAALWNYEMSGRWQSDWRVIQANLHGDYDLPVNGLSARGSYSYYFASNLLNNHEYTYDAYTYEPGEDSYIRTGGSSNPWQEREQTLITENVFQGQLEYNNNIANHNIDAIAVAEWYERDNRSNWLHNVPEVNESSIIRYSAIDTYNDNHTEEARIGYIGRFSYNYANKYYLEFSGRYDASWKWPPNNRWGFFPSVSAGWRITEEPFFTSLVGEDVLTNLKFRASYGILGDDEVDIDPYGYIPGYNYASGTVIFDGEEVNTSGDRGVPVTNITWYKSKMTNVGADFELLEGTLEGSIDYFYRKRTDLLASRNDLLIPRELGYDLPQENLESDAQMGGEFSLTYNGNFNDISYSINGNISYSRSKFLDSYNPRFGNSWDQYRNSDERRWEGVFWGYEVSGRFQSQEEINNYEVNIDGQGNTTLLPGDFIYKDVNGDGVINEYDERPIGYNTGSPPSLYGGLGFTVGWKGVDLVADFSFGGMYSYNRNWEARWPFQNNGNLLNSYLDRWHREDPYDLDSDWIAGENPPLRFNDSGHSNYNKNSTYWLINVRYLRLRTLQVGYSLPQSVTEKLPLSQARLYVNTYNLFSIDNLKNQASFLDPEVSDENGLQYPQMKSLNIGVNLTF